MHFLTNLPQFLYHFGCSDAFIQVAVTVQKSFSLYHQNPSFLGAHLYHWVNWSKVGRVKLWNGGKWTWASSLNRQSGVLLRTVTDRSSVSLFPFSQLKLHLSYLYFNVVHILFLSTKQPCLVLSLIQNSFNRIYDGIAKCSKCLASILMPWGTLLLDHWSHDR